MAHFETRDGRCVAVKENGKPFRILQLTDIHIGGDILVAVSEKAMFERAVKITELFFVCPCPHFAVVVAEHNRPRLAEFFHNGGKHFARFKVVETALIEPRHRIHHIPRHDHEIGV